MKKRFLWGRWPVGLVGLALLTAFSPTAADASSPDIDWEKAAEAFLAQRWDDAARGYRAIVEAHPDSAFAWFRLGLIHRQLGQPREAIDAFEHSGEAGAFADPNVIRMLTEVHIESGDEAGAYRWLDRYVAIGLRPEAMLSNPEFARLRDDPRFRERVRQAEQNDRKCEASAFRQFDFWLGDWDVTNHHGVVAGTDRIERSLNGCVIEEHYSGFRGNHALSVSFHDQSRDLWRQLWFTDDGSVFEFEGGFRDGKMQLEREIESPNGTAVRRRLTWFPIDGGRVRQLFENSSDGGQSWFTLFKLTYTPRGDASPDAVSSSPTQP